MLRNLETDSCIQVYLFPILDTPGADKILGIIILNFDEAKYMTKNVYYLLNQTVHIHTLSRQYIMPQQTGDN